MQSFHIFNATEKPFMRALSFFVLSVFLCVTAWAEKPLTYRVGQTWTYDNSNGSEIHNVKSKGIRTLAEKKRKNS